MKTEQQIKDVIEDLKHRQQQLIPSADNYYPIYKEMQTIVEYLLWVINDNHLKGGLKNKNGKK